MTSKPPFGGEAVRLNQLCSKGKSNLRQKDIENDGPFNVYGASGIVGRMDTYQNERPYVGIVKDGAGVGRAMLCEGKTSVLGTMQALLPNEGTNLSYLLHLVRSLKLGENYSGSTIPHIYFKDYGRQEVPALSAGQQSAIAERLDLAEQLMALIDDETAKLDSLVKSRFVEMFGDPVENPMGWPCEKLGDLGELKNGVNFKAADSGCEIKCLGVSDFKNRYSVSNMDLISTVTLNGEPTEKQMLRDGDVVFVRSNGNKQLVGRCLAVFPGDARLTFSGFCIRFRNESDSLLLDYLLVCLKSDSMRKAMSGRGANIQNLSQGLLSKVDVPLPPLELQSEFADFTARVDKLRFVVFGGP